MAIKVYATDDIDAGVIVDLGEFNSAFISAGATIASLDTNAIVGTGNKQSVTVYGNVIGETRGIWLGNDGGGDFGFRVTIGSTGVVMSNTSTAISIQGYSSRLTNSGDILSAGVGINVDSYNDQTFTYVLNKGTMDTDGTTVRHTGTERMVIENEGRMTSSNLVIDASDATMEITNSGLMVGKITLRGGADIFDTTEGKFKGSLNSGDGIDKLLGSAYADNFDADAGNDFIFGYAGNDTLRGSAGNDYIDGGVGNDFLYGGTGNDTLIGGSGADRFIFTSISESTVSASGRDRIFGFSHAQADRMDLSLIDANNKTGANDAFKYIGTSAFSGVAGQLRAVESGSSMLVYGDINGDKKADFAIELSSISKLLASDFIL